jgi:hypothetical protein
VRAVAGEEHVLVQGEVVVVVEQGVGRQQAEGAATHGSKIRTGKDHYSFQGILFYQYNSLRVNSEEKFGGKSLIFVRRKAELEQ